MIYNILFITTILFIIVFLITILSIITIPFIINFLIYVHFTNFMGNIRNSIKNKKRKIWMKEIINNNLIMMIELINWMNIERKIVKDAKFV